MLHKHEVDLIENCFQSIELCGVELPDYVKAKIERSKQALAKFYERKIEEQKAAYATAIGTKPSQGLMDSIAADCATFGCD
jgi:hypothetical protein